VSAPSAKRPTAVTNSGTDQYRIYFQHGVVEATSGEHEAVLAALRAGDAAGAEQAMLDHIQKSYARIAASMEATEE